MIFNLSFRSAAGIILSLMNFTHLLISLVVACASNSLINRCSVLKMCSAPPASLNLKSAEVSSSSTLWHENIEYETLLYANFAMVFEKVPNVLFSAADVSPWTICCKPFVGSNIITTSESSNKSVMTRTLHSAKIKHFRNETFEIRMFRPTQNDCTRTDTQNDRLARTKPRE